MIKPYKVMNRLFTTMYEIITWSLSAKFSRARYRVTFPPLGTFSLMPKFFPLSLIDFSAEIFIYLIINYLFNYHSMVEHRVIPKLNFKS